MQKEQIIDAILSLENPYSKKECTHDELPEITFNDSKDRLTLTFPFPKGDSEPFTQFQRALLAKLKIDLGIPYVRLEFKTPNEEPTVEPDTTQRDPEVLEDTLLSLMKTKDIRFLAIASGKGGVGKSQTTIQLVKAFQRSGLKVAIIDADIYGASIPKILGVQHTFAQTSEQTLRALDVNGIEVVSSDMLFEDNQPIIWRGPMLGKLLNHFFNEFMWSSDIQICLIDLPPGTGDVPLDLQQLVPYLETIIVTTPHEDAVHIATRAGHFAQSMEQEIVGVIENMSYFLGNDNEKYYIFGRDGGAHVAHTLNASLLAQIPLVSNDPKAKSPSLDPYFDALIQIL